MFHLVVTKQFGQYAIGERITDPAEVDAVKRDCPECVVQVLAPSEPASEPKARRKSATE